MVTTPSEGTPRGAPPLRAWAQRTRHPTLQEKFRWHTQDRKKEERVDIGLPGLTKQCVFIGTGHGLPSKSGVLKRMGAGGEELGAPSVHHKRGDQLHSGRLQYEHDSDGDAPLLVPFYGWRHICLPPPCLSQHCVGFQATLQRGTCHSLNWLQLWLQLWLQHSNFGPPPPLWTNPITGPPSGMVGQSVWPIVLRVHTSKADNTGSCPGCVCIHPTNCPPKLVPLLTASTKLVARTMHWVRVCDSCCGMCKPPTMTPFSAIFPHSNPIVSFPCLATSITTWSISPINPLGARLSMCPSLIVVVVVLVPGCPPPISPSTFFAPRPGALSLGVLLLVDGGPSGLRHRSPSPALVACPSPPSPPPPAPKSL